MFTFDLNRVKAAALSIYRWTQSDSISCLILQLCRLEACRLSLMQTTEAGVVQRVICLHQRLNSLIGPNRVIHLQIWRQVLTWSSWARKPFRLIDGMLSAGAKYCVAEMISAATEEISCRCIFTQCSWVSAFFLLHLFFFPLVRSSKGI